MMATVTPSTSGAVNGGATISMSTNGLIKWLQSNNLEDYRLIQVMVDEEIESIDDLFRVFNKNNQFEKLKEILITKEIKIGRISKLIKALNEETNYVNIPQSAHSNIVIVTSLEEGKNINKIQDELANSYKVENILNSYDKEVDTHSDAIKSKVNGRFERIIKSLQDRQKTIYAEIDDWKAQKHKNINKAITNTVEYNKELEVTINSIKELLANDKLSSDKREKGIKDIVHKLFNDGNNGDNDKKYQQYQDIESLKKYIKNTTNLIDIRFPESIPMNTLESYGELIDDIESNPFIVPSITLSKPVKTQENDCDDSYKINLEWNGVTKQNEPDFTIKYNEKSGYNDDDDDKKDEMNENKDKEWKILKHKTIEFAQNSYNVEIENDFVFDKHYEFMVNAEIGHPLNILIKSNITSFMIETPMDLSKEEEISLQIHSHKGHDGNYVPERMLQSDDQYYLSPDKQITNDWIIFDINNANNTYYYPTKLKVKAVSGGNNELKRFRLKIGNSAKNEWMECNKEIFTAQQIKTMQTFNLDIIDNNNNLNKDIYRKWKQININKWTQFKLQVLDNQGGTNYILITQFKLFGVKKTNK